MKAWLAALLALAATGDDALLSPEVAAGAGHGNQYQCDLRCNPLNPKQMVITAKLGNKEQETIAFHTADGGATWSSTIQPASGDPDVVYDLNGTAHWTFIDKVGGKTTGYRRSKDGGKTWEDKRPLPAAIDHLHVACDRGGSSPRKNSIYVAGRLFKGGGVVVLRSRDGGDTFNAASVPLEGRLGLGFVFAPATLADGTLLIPMVTANNFLVDGNKYAGNVKELYCLRSTDGGETFDPPIRIAPLLSLAGAGPGGASCLGGFAVGKRKGGQRVYLTYPSSRPGLPAVLLMTTSDDGGRTWTQPRAIAPSAPAGWGAGSSSVMTNADGVVGVQWYGMRDDAFFDLYFTASTDGGATFGPPARVSTASTTVPPNQPRYPGQDQVYGDAAPDGSFRLVWSDARGAAPTYTTWFRTLKVEKAAPAAPSTLGVVNGFGGGIYTKAAVVAVTAAAPPAGQEFAGWTATGGVVLKNADAPIAEATLVGDKGTVTAAYRPQVLHELTVEGGRGSGKYPAGSLVSIVADAGLPFERWTGPDGLPMHDPKSASTKILMPPRATTVAATFKK